MYSYENEARLHQHLYTELEILEMVLYEIMMRREQAFLKRVKYVKNDPATGEKLYQIIPEPPPSVWNKIAFLASLVVVGGLLAVFVVSLLYCIFASLFLAI